MSVMSGDRPMSTRPSGPRPKRLWVEYMPPLSPVSYVVMLFLPYFAQVFGNAVTYRQIQYANDFLAKYGKPMEPLPDTSILEGVSLPAFATRLALRDWVNVLSAVWCLACVLIWFCRGSARWTNFSTFLAAQTILVPLCAISQWLTTVPDSDPQCLEYVDVPSEGTEWIWSRFGLYQCGDMMWSSAIVQFVLFSFLSFGNIESRCLSALTVFITFIILIVLSIVAWVGRYQYVCDIILSVFLSACVVTHPYVETFGEFLFKTQCVPDFDDDDSNISLIHRERRSRNGEDDEEDIEFAINDDSI